MIIKYQRNENKIKRKDIKKELKIDDKTELLNSNKLFIRIINIIINLIIKYQRDH